jgi:peptide/nickel transport system permease protein
MGTFKKLFKNPSFVFGFTTFILIVLIGLFGPLFVSMDPFATDFMPFMEPSADHWLGTNNLGQDVFSRLLYGLRSSLYVGLTAGVFATIIGTFVGIYGGYKGGIVDNFFTLTTNLMLVIPQLVVLILISNSIENKSLTLIAFIIGITSWTWVARAVSAQAASLKTRDHVNLAKLNGFNTLSILIRQILPYILSYVFMAFILQLTSGILSEAALSMLGLGPETSSSVSLGSILNNAQNNEALESGYWWVFIPPTISITLIAFSLYVVNTSMEGVFNPRLRK